MEAFTSYATKATRACHTLSGVKSVKFHAYIPILEEIGPIDRFLLPKTHICEIRVSGVRTPVKHAILGISTNFRQNQWNRSQVMLQKPPGHVIC